MKKNVMLGIMLALMLTMMLMLAFNIQPAKASGTIYVRADGSVDPPDAPVITLDNVTYTFTGNISYPNYYGIVVERSNIVIDGNGYTVQGNQSGNGLSLTSISNVTIKNTSIRNFYYGIYLYESSNNTISGNNITANKEYGIYLYESSNNIIFGNNITANNYYGILLLYSSNYNSIYHNNFVNNAQQAYTYGSYDNVWDEGYPSGGNYWSDYVGVDYYSGPDQDMPGSDGIGDTGTNQDRYPLMNPWGTGTPVADFSWSPTTPEVDELVTFDASASMPVGGEIVSYEWDFGDGNYASGKIVTHKYASAGYFTITLNITDSEGLWDIEQKQIEVKAPPPPLTVSITPLSASIIVGQSVTFTSTVSGGYTPYSYQWYLNGNPVSGATSDTWTFTPTTEGIYYIYLKVTDARDNTAQSETARVEVAAVPVGGYSVSLSKDIPTLKLINYTLAIALFSIALSLLKRKRK